MRMGPLILLAATVAVTAWLAPMLPVAGPPLRAVQAHAPVDREAESRRAAWLAGGVSIERAGDGHFYTDAAVDARPIRFLIDTGASAVALTGSDARAIGMAWHDADLVPVGRGANGTVYGVPVRLDRVELGNLTARDVDAAIIPEGLDVSLLGQSFLSRLQSVRIDGDRMILGGG